MPDSFRAASGIRSLGWGVQLFAWLAGLVWLLAGGADAPMPTRWIWGATLLVGLGAVIATWRGKISVWEALMIEAGALATATSALGLFHWHVIAKPAAMVFAIAAVAADACQSSAGGTFRLNGSQRWLLGALLGSLAGDVFLMGQGLFIPGLVSFLLAHVCYIALFRVGVPWLAHRLALAATVLLGLGMAVFLWRGGLPAELRAPVAVYVLAIALMAAQAWARWRQLASRSALCVALGASCFMLSDSLLATDRFVQRLPWASLWVLATYYLAQALIVMGMLRSMRGPRR
ncbi:MAG: lysoplasmalogenase [Comamonas sp.]